MTTKPIRRVAIIGTGVIGASWTALKPRAVLLDALADVFGGEENEQRGRIMVREIRGKHGRNYPSTAGHQRALVTWQPIAERWRPLSRETRTD